MVRWPFTDGAWVVHAAPSIGSTEAINVRLATRRSTALAPRSLTRHLPRNLLEAQGSCARGLTPRLGPGDPTSASQVHDFEAEPSRLKGRPTDESSVIICSGRLNPAEFRKGPTMGLAQHCLDSYMDEKDLEDIDKNLSQDGRAWSALTFDVVEVEVDHIGKMVTFLDVLDADASEVVTFHEYLNMRRARGEVPW